MDGVMKKDANISIKILQTSRDKKSSNFEIFTTGYFKKQKDKWIVEYENEYNGTTKIVLFEEGNVLIVAKGDIFYTLKLNKKISTKFSCKTKNTFSYFNVITKEIMFKLNNEGGRIEIEYFLEIDSLGESLKNKIQMELKVKNREEV